MSSSSEKLRTEVRTNLTARVGATGIVTADPESVVEDLIRTSRDSAHQILNWNSGRGLNFLIAQRGDRGIEVNYTNTDWDDDTQGDPNTVLLNLLEGVWPHAEDQLYRTRRNRRAPDVLTFVHQETGELSTLKSEYEVVAPVITAVIFEGLEPFLDPNSSSHDPLAVQNLVNLAREVGPRYLNLLLVLPIGCQLDPALDNTICRVQHEVPCPEELQGLWLQTVMAEVSRYGADEGARSPLLRPYPLAPYMEGGEDNEVVLDFRRRVVQSLQGLPARAAAVSIRRTIAHLKGMYGRELPHTYCEKVSEEFLDALQKRKAENIRKSGALELGKPVPPEDVGGLDRLMCWFREQACAFSPEARALGVRPPKGALLVGIPGTGKSLAAKALASVLGLPLIKFDPSKLLGGLVGQSEGNADRAFALLNAVAPCVVSIDEIEKTLGGGGDRGDSGVSRRVLGKLLNWMQEGAEGVVVVATANDLSGLPPEFIRKGRFDEIFFVDLPNAVERRAVFEIHLGKLPEGRVAELSDADWQQLLRVTEGYSGAEIEAIVNMANVKAFSAGDAKVSPLHVAVAAKEVIPLSQSRGEEIAGNRRFAEGRFRFASTPTQDDPKLPPEEKEEAPLFLDELDSLEDL